MYIYAFLFGMTDTMTSQNIDISSWDTLYRLIYTSHQSSLIQDFRCHAQHFAPRKKKKKNLLIYIRLYIYPSVYFSHFVSVERLIVQTNRKDQRYNPDKIVNIIVMYLGSNPSNFCPSLIRKHWDRDYNESVAILHFTVAMERNMFPLHYGVVYSFFISLKRTELYVRAIINSVPKFYVSEMSNTVGPFKYWHIIFFIQPAPQEYILKITERSSGKM
jgi:hypothetical protein